MEGFTFLNPFFERGVAPSLFVSLILCGIGLPIPEEALFVLAGYFGRRMGIDPIDLCMAGIAGILIGDLIPYLTGRFFGPLLLNNHSFQKVLPSKLRERIELFFQRHGTKTIFVARFVAGFRTPTLLLAGSMKMPIAAVVVWDGLGALISCPTSIYLAFQYGEVALQWIADSQRLVAGIVIGVACLALVVWLLKRQKNAVREHYPKPTRLVIAAYSISRGILRLMMRVLFRFEVEGAEKIPATGPVILVANHASFIDPIFLACSTQRYVQFLMYSTFYNSFARPLFRFLRTLPIDENDYVSALKDGLRALKDGGCLGIFPEGAVSYDGKLLEMKGGALLLAQRAQALLIPVTITGSHDVLPRGAWFPRPRKIKMIVGLPRVVESELTRDELDKLLVQIRYEMDQNLAKFSAGLQTGTMVK